MKKRGKKEKSILFRLFLLGVCAYFTVTLVMLWKSLNQSREELGILQAQKETMQNDIEQLRALLSSEDDRGIIEKAARERLGYVYSDEQVFIDISGS